MESLSFSNSGGQFAAIKSLPDSNVFSHPVYDLKSLQLSADPELLLSKLQNELPKLRARLDVQKMLVSARIPSTSHAKIDFLQALGFQFRELSLHPEIETEKVQHFDSALVHIGSVTDKIKILKIAGSAFAVTRFHRDSLTPDHLANARYENWVSSSLEDQDKEIFEFRDETDDIVGFFLNDYSDPGISNWQLTAISPTAQGLGFAKDIWRTMMSVEKSRGVKAIQTTISADNLPVVGLYPKLGFRYRDSSVVLHGWF
jgi:RimJ/RimL family protein N-acetyltransferase